MAGMRTMMNPMKRKMMMSEDLSDKTCLVVAHGLFAELAVKLAQSFNKTYLYIPWQDAFPVIQKGMLGEGLEGITKVDDVFGPHFDSIDLFVFPDLYHAELQLQLETMGKRVWGCRRGEELELYRGLCKEAMTARGLPVHGWKALKGIDALRSHLQTTPAQHVKLDKYRGMFETFFAKNYDLISPKLDELQQLFGPFSNEMEFICEDDLPDCVEVGLDCYTVDGQFPTATLAGIEVKDLGYIGQFRQWDDLPKEVTGWFEGMSDLFKSYGYRGFLSNELRIGKSRVPYMIDCCARAACPPSELYQEFYTNFADIIWQGAGGKLIDPEPVSAWGVEIIMSSDWAEKHWQAIDFPEALRHRVKLFNSVRVEGKLHIAPQEEEISQIGAILGWGETLESALKMVDETAEEIAGYGVTIPRGSLDEAEKRIEQLDKTGIKLFAP